VAFFGVKFTQHDHRLHRSFGATEFSSHGSLPVINEDLNPLLPPARFQPIRKIRLPERLAYMAGERSRPVNTGGFFTRSFLYANF
jgi:hypothetical protein